MFKKKLLAAFLAVGISLTCATGISAHSRHHHKRHHHSKIRKIAGIAAPIGVGMAFGPAGSVGYQVVKHRHTIKRHLTHHRR